ENVRDGGRGGRVPGQRVQLALNDDGGRCFVHGQGHLRNTRLQSFYPFCCPPAPPRKSGRRDAGARDTISLAVFSTPITRPELQILKKRPRSSTESPQQPCCGMANTPWFYRRKSDATQPVGDCPWRPRGRRSGPGATRRTRERRG